MASTAVLCPELVFGEAVGVLERVSGEAVGVIAEVLVSTPEAGGAPCLARSPPQAAATTTRPDNMTIANFTSMYRLSRRSSIEAPAPNLEDGP